MHRKRTSRRMKQLKRKLILTLTIMQIGIGCGIGWLLTTNQLVTFSIPYYRTIPIFFFVIGIIFIATVTKSNKNTEEKKILNLYLIIRLIKLLLSGAFVLIYWMIYPNEMKKFILIFGIFYLLYLVFETYTYAKIERRLKQDKEKDTENKE